jgi:phenylpyruvate tautomerase PptA (4-oxalocrotonate tautomerase family)
MSILEILLPSDALTADAEDELLASLTDVLVKLEGADPSNIHARDSVWIFVHRPEKVFVGGEAANPPRYRVTLAIPEGHYDDLRCAAAVKEVTERILIAEEGFYRRDPSRICVMITEIRDGTWGAAGRIVRLSDIAGDVLGDPAAGVGYAMARLTTRAKRA